MSRQKNNETPAEFVRAQGWAVGDILAGGPIRIGGAEIEQGFTVRLTAIGKRTVLAERRHNFIPNWWADEHAMTFGSRDWMRSSSARDWSVLSDRVETYRQVVCEALGSAGWEINTGDELDATLRTLLSVGMDSLLTSRT